MRLSDKESDILACVDLRADLSIDEIRKQTGYRDHTIRYHLKRLRERGVIRRAPFINMGTLGYTMNNIFFSLNSESEDLKQELFAELSRIPEVLWVAELSAEFQYALDICAERIHDVQRILNGLSEKFGNIFFQKTVSSQFSSHFFPRGYLSSKKFDHKILSIQPSDRIVEIDELDDRILAALWTHGESSRRRIAQHLEMPLSTLELRIKKLEERGVIEGYFYAIDPSKYNYETFKLIVYGKGVDPKLTKQLIEFGYNHPHIVGLWECYGSWDYELAVEVQKAEEVINITQSLYKTFGNSLNTVRTISKFRTIKFHLYPIRNLQEAA